MSPKEIRQISNTRAIEFSHYINTRGGSRVRLKDRYFGTKKIIGADSSYRRTVEQALDYLANELGFKIRAATIHPDGSGVIFMKKWDAHIQLGGK
jgi:hypothetical protein